MSFVEVGIRSVGAMTPLSTSISLRPLRHAALSSGSLPPIGKFSLGSLKSRPPRALPKLNFLLVGGHHYLVQHVSVDEGIQANSCDSEAKEAHPRS